MAASLTVATAVRGTGDGRLCLVDWLTAFDARFGDAPAALMQRRTFTYSGARHFVDDLVLRRFNQSGLCGAIRRDRLTRATRMRRTATTDKVRAVRRRRRESS